MREFFIFLAIIFIAIILWFYSSFSNNNTLNSFFSGLIGALIGISYTVYKASFDTPNLEIVYKNKEDRDIFQPSIRMQPTDIFSVFDRKHLRLIIKNTGKLVAKSCSAQVKIDRDGRLNGCKTFSSEPKNLIWISPSTELKTSIDISPHGGEQYLEVIFSDKRESSVRIYSPNGSQYCSIKNKENQPLLAYASTPAAYDIKLGPYRRNQDGFCVGEFRIIITIYAENTKPVSKKFTLKISENWDETTMEVA